MVLGSPCACIRITGAWACATRLALASSKPSADTSLIIRAPAFKAAVITAALRVSAETMWAFDSPAMTPSTRAISSSVVTVSEPGRVDSPPTSRISAPSLASFRPWAIPASTFAKRPPSENESGVTLTIPMTRVASMPMPPNAWRGLVMFSISARSERSA